MLKGLKFVSIVFCEKSYCVISNMLSRLKLTQKRYALTGHKCVMNKKEQILVNFGQS